MAHRIVLPPSVEPVTVAFFRDHAKLDGSESDDLLSMYLKAARQSIEHIMQRSIMEQKHAITLDTFPDAIELQCPSVPSASGDCVLVAAIESLSYYDTAGSKITMSPTAYALDAYTVPGWVVPAVGTTWPETQARINAVEVIYTVGLDDADDVPAAIKHVICLRASAALENREELTPSGLSVLPFAERMLDEYRIWNL